MTLPTETTPPTEVPAPPWRALPVLLAAALAVCTTLLIGPQAPELGPETMGDPTLAGAARQAVGDGSGFDTLGVATGADVAGLGGANADTPFELGSVTKALTGMLLADLSESGVVAVDDTLGELLPGMTFRDPDVADTTLEQLATHRSGLPRDVPGHLFGRYTQMLGNDPFGELSPQDVLDAAASVDAGAREPAYSNLGFALLGQTLAEHTGTPYRDLLRQRILAPLGMDGTVVVAPGEALPAGAGPGRTAGGTLVAPWRGWGLAPAGGAVWSTAADLGRLLDGVASGTAPGASAAEPRADYTDGRRIGFAWITTTYPDDRTVTWHNGATTGYRTWAGLDRETGETAAVLSSTGHGVDHVGLRLLGVERDGPGPPWTVVGVTVFLAFLASVAMAEAVPGRKRVPRDRLGVPGAVASAVLLLWLTALLGAWHVVPPVLWAVALICVAVGVVRVGQWWPSLPWVVGGASRRRRIVGGAGSLLVSAAIAGVLFWVTV